MLSRIALLCALSLAALPALAGSQQYDQVEFGSSAEQEVANDLMTAHLGIEVNASRPDEVARQINAALNAALNIAAAFGNVKAASGNQTTWPVYGKTGNRVQGWRGRAGIRLQSRDFAEMGKLIAQLQQTMQLQGVGFKLSSETRERVENKLIVRAIAAFRKRAKEVSTALGGSGFRIIHLTINKGGGYVRPMLAREAMATSAIAQPKFAGGDSTMTVQAAGTIQVVR